jgi:hypothetical protein
MHLYSSCLSVVSTYCYHFKNYFLPSLFVFFLPFSFAYCPTLDMSGPVASLDTDSVTADLVPSRGNNLQVLGLARHGPVQNVGLQSWV